MLGQLHCAAVGVLDGPGKVLTRVGDLSSATDESKDDKTLRERHFPRAILEMALEVRLELGDASVPVAPGAKPAPEALRDSC